MEPFAKALDQVTGQIDNGTLADNLNTFQCKVDLFDDDANGLWESPDFMDPDNDDFHLQSGSPCIEAGMPIAGLTLDFDGHPLGRGTNPDIGAFETLKGGPRNI